MNLATTSNYTLSLHDALPILGGETLQGQGAVLGYELAGVYSEGKLSYPSYPANLSGNIRLSLLGTCPIIYPELFKLNLDRKSTRLNSSHVKISYAVFCLKKQK